MNVEWNVYVNGNYVGNGTDMVADWTYSDRDDFNAAMDAFNPEDFA